MFHSWSPFVFLSNCNTDSYEVKCRGGWFLAYWVWELWYSASSSLGSLPFGNCQLTWVLLPLLLLFFFIIEPIYYCNILFQPLGPCILQETVWVMLTRSAFLIKGEIESKRGLLSDSFILKNVHGSASPHVTHFHSHEKQQKDTSLGLNYVHLWETKIFNNNNKSPSISPSSQPVIMRQFQWLCLAGDFSERVRTVERHWPKKRRCRKGEHFKWEYIRPPFWPFILSPFQVTVSSQFTEILPELCLDAVSSRKLSLVCTSCICFLSNVTHTFSYCLLSLSASHLSCLSTCLMTPIFSRHAPEIGPQVDHSSIPIALPH